MWHREYQARLAAWVDLRNRSTNLPISECLLSIESWWQASPWRPYYLHWDERETWPDPWQLLADNVFCDVARALGMLYTVYLLDREDCQTFEMVEAEQGNLVLVQQGKYIMNWIPDSIVNIRSKELRIKTVLEPTFLARITR